LVSGSLAGAMAMLIIAALTIYFGRLFVANLEGAAGRLSNDEVTVQRARGLPLAGRDGRFPMNRFKAVRVERMPPPVEAQDGPHERVRLIGNEGTPDILIARTQRGAGVTLAGGLASDLKLAFEEVSLPY
jgi:hypothetical protein